MVKSLQTGARIIRILKARSKLAQRLDGNVTECVPSRRGLEVGEVGVKDADAVVAHHVDDVYVCESGSQLANHLPPVLQQHGVQLALIVTQGDVPGQDVVSVGQVEHWEETEIERGFQCRLALFRRDEKMNGSVKWSFICQRWCLISFFSVTKPRIKLLQS